MVIERIHELRLTGAAAGLKPPHHHGKGDTPKSSGWAASSPKKPANFLNNVNPDAKRFVVVIVPQGRQNLAAMRRSRN